MIEKDFDNTLLGIMKNMLDEHDASEDQGKQDNCVEWSLCDDGTLDTVVSIHCQYCGTDFEERYSDTSGCRDEDGSIIESEFTEMLASYDHECPECGEYL